MKIYTIHSSDCKLIVRDNDTGDIVGAVFSTTTICARTNSHDIVAECGELIPGPIDTVEHDRGEVIVTTRD